MNVLYAGSDWHRLRSKVVGGSEIAALFGCQQPYQMGLYELWHVKAGNVPVPDLDGERIEWGNDLEDAIAHVAARRKGWAITKGGHVPDPVTPGLGCTLDYIIHADPDEDGPGALEIKNLDFLVHRDKWADGEPPSHILLQLQTQLACTGYKWGYVAALVGGNKLELYRFEARPAIIAEIRKRVLAFWKSIEAGTQPDVDGSDGAFRVLRELHPAPVEEELDLRGHNEFPVACALLAEASARRRTAEKEEAEAKAKIMDILGNHKRGFDGIWRASLSITAPKPDRVAMPGEIIRGRAEIRRLIIKEAAA